MGGALGAVAVAARGPLRNWGATAEERQRPLPGDGLIPGERATCTMATTIAAPPVAVWPWLAQMGADRAGWYSFDRLDNGGRPSADTLDPLWTRVTEGDRMTTVPGRGRPFDPRAGRPRVFVDSRWEFVLDALPDGGTRLLVRSGGDAGPRPLTVLVDLLFWHPAHVVMQLRQLRELKRRAQWHAATLAAGEPHCVVGAGLG